MWKYRQLAGQQEFRCAECGRRKKVKFIPASELCRKCAAKRRRREPNTLIATATDVVVTKAVEKRLRKKAEAKAPYTEALVFGEMVHRWIFIPFWVSGYFVTTALTHDWTSERWLLILGFYLLFPFLCMTLMDKILDKPRRQRMHQVTSRFLQLVEERKEWIAERDRFYSSPEWAALRRQVVEEEGRTCAQCGKQIVEDTDITVDHKCPRSRHPHLALRRENLRVLCRRCNSRKGAEDWLGV